MPAASVAVAAMFAVLVSCSAFGVLVYGPPGPPGVPYGVFDGATVAVQMIGVLVGALVGVRVGVLVGCTNAVGPGVGVLTQNPDVVYPLMDKSIPSKPADEYALEEFSSTRQYPDRTETERRT